MNASSASGLCRVKGLDPSLSPSFHRSVTSGHLSEVHHAILGGDDVTGCFICISQGSPEKQNQ